MLEQDEKELAVLADVSAVARTAMPCVVSITNEYTAYDYWYDEEYDERANGSGIVVAQSSEELLIVTNYHVKTTTIYMCSLSTTGRRWRM